MKAINIFRILGIGMMFMLITAITVNAEKPAISPAQHIQKTIKESIKYPAQAQKHCCQGSVDVYFTINSEGKIVIEDIWGDKEDLVKNVKEQLSSICCKGIKAPYNEHYAITITFKLV